MGHTVVKGSARLEDRAGMAAELDRVAPTAVLDSAGLTGRPNVDWCESNKLEVLRVNAVGTLSLAELCAARGIHATIFATGCIYEYTSGGAHDMPAIGAPPNSNGGAYTEADAPNFVGSFYSRTKGHLDGLLSCFPEHVLTLRVRMPLSDEYEHPRNFITKITHYKRVVNIPNSMTVLEEMLPIAIDMSLRRRTGVYNFTNPGAISHNEVLDLYKKYVHPEFTYENFTLEEQAKILAAGRSNCELDSSKLQAEYPDLQEIHVATEELFKRMATKKPEGATCPVPSR
eukprot:CAMPEP_0170745964 /NCGR_PEP_ID=MMETSP0437-20130122/8561_1 /TAXON_ID=0 /ORGANISM="Sexangularia sp." /LENGTH=285 /DNA_ID=CAMNT_0011084693 /DNA_START=137 /DNA_END=994 /DNA_ORIENTATION=-